MSEEGKSRFILPVVFIILGVAVAVYAVLRIMGTIGGPLAAHDLVGPIEGGFTLDIVGVMALAMPLYLIEFLLLAIPFAAIMIFLNRLYRAKSYTQSVMAVGGRFGATRIIRRALLPSIFARSFSDIALNFLPAFIIAVPEYPTEVAYTTIVRTVEPVIWFIGALFALGVAIPIYAPTWLLNDSGIVSHLKQNELEMRRCPDTEGVGKWFSQYLSGFAILSYPLATAHKFIVVLPSLILTRGGTIGLDYIIESLVWIIGLPLLVMAFVMPIIIINELVLPKTTPILKGVARSLGATDLRLGDVEPVGLQDDTQQYPQ
jgi:hypothetical protein